MPFVSVLWVVATKCVAGALCEAVFRNAPGQNTGLVQESVLAPILFNIYTNNQPPPDKSKTFAYANDLAITVKVRRFEDIEERLEMTLNKMSTFIIS